MPTSLKTCQKDLKITFLGKWMFNPQEGGRLVAKRHYVILAKALDGIWLVCYACAVLCWGTAAGAPALHCTGMTNWPTTIQCLGYDDLMSFRIKSFATEGIHDEFLDP